MRFGTWPEDRHAKTLPNFYRERPKTDRLAPDSFFWAGLASFSREEIQSGGDRSVFFFFRDKNLQAAVRYACGGTCKFSWSRLKK